MMASNQRSCLFHAESSLSFCLNHGIYCCPHCHTTSNVGCEIKSEEDAVEYFRNEVQTSLVMLKQSTERCANVKLSLTELHGVIQKHHGDTVDNVHTLCDKLRSVVDRFEADANLDANQESQRHADSLGKHVESVEILSEFSNTLNRLLDGDSGSSAQQQNTTLTNIDINKIRISMEQFRDGFSAVSERLKTMECLSFDEFHAPIHIEISRVDNLIDELSKICQDSTKEYNTWRPEDASTSMLTGPHNRPMSAPLNSMKPLKPFKPMPSSDPAEQLDGNSLKSSSTQHYGIGWEYVDNKSGCVLPDKPIQHAPVPSIEDDHQLMCEKTNMPNIECEQRGSVKSHSFDSDLTNSFSTKFRESVQSHSTDSEVADSCSAECREPVASPTLDENSKMSVEKSKVFSSEESATLMSSENIAHTPLTIPHEGCPTDEQPLFTKIGELSYNGRRPAVCLVPSTADHILLAVAKPNVLIKFDESGIEIIRRETHTAINDMCVRGTRIYATNSECSVRVLDVDTLSSVETLCGIGVCRGIHSYGEDFVITCATGDHKGVYIVGINTGALHVRRKSSYIFKYPTCVTSSASLDKIVVSDSDKHSVVILSSDLSPIRTLNLGTNMMGPTGLCLIEESVIIAFHQSKSVIEYGIDGRYIRTIFHAVGSPRAISYYNESRTLAVSSTENPKSVFIFKKKVSECEKSGGMTTDLSVKTYPIPGEPNISVLPNKADEKYQHTSQGDSSEMNTTQMTTTESQAVNGSKNRPTYRKIFDFNFVGSDPVARYTQSSPAIIILTTKQPHAIRTVDAKGKQLAYNNTPVSVNDFAVQETEIYTSDYDGNIRVYSIQNLSPVRVISCGFQECRGIITTNEGFAILQKSRDCWFLSRINATGECEDNFSRTFWDPLFVALTPKNGIAFVSDPVMQTVAVAKVNSTSSQRLSHPLLRRPNGLCVIGDHIYVACHKSRCVLEFHADGRFRRTVLTEDDGIGSPRTISYHRDSGRLVVSSTADPKKIIIFASEG